MLLYPKVDTSCGKPLRLGSQVELSGVLNVVTMSKTELASECTSNGSVDTSTCITAWVVSFRYSCLYLTRTGSGGCEGAVLVFAVDVPTSLLLDPGMPSKLMGSGELSLHSRSEASHRTR